VISKHMVSYSIFKTCCSLSKHFCKMKKPI